MLGQKRASVRLHHGSIERQPAKKVGYRTRQRSTLWAPTRRAVILRGAGGIDRRHFRARVMKAPFSFWLAMIRLPSVLLAVCNSEAQGAAGNTAGRTCCPHSDDATAHLHLHGQLPVVNRLVRGGSDMETTIAVCRIRTLTAWCKTAQTFRRRRPKFTACLSWIVDCLPRGVLVTSIQDTR